MFIHISVTALLALPLLARAAAIPIVVPRDDDNVITSRQTIPSLPALPIPIPVIPALPAPAAPAAPPAIPALPFSIPTLPVPFPALPAPPAFPAFPPIPTFTLPVVAPAVARGEPEVTILPYPFPPALPTGAPLVYCRRALTAPSAITSGQPEVTILPYPFPVPSTVPHAPGPVVHCG